jgi:lipoprotein-releasing system ATP-binding protein
MQLLVEVNGLTKTYQAGAGQVEVLRGIDLSIGQGERIAVLGASGAGKSTLMHILGGLDLPTSGSVRVGGDDVFALRGQALDAFRNRTIGFVFQFHQLLPEFSALENVMLPALIARQPWKTAQAGAERLLHDVGLSHRLTHKPGELSGGEQQRVAIARALVMEPRLLLADEPTGNLDSQTAAEIFALLDRLHHNRGLTMVIVTHSEALAGRLDRQIRMQDGRLVDGVSGLHPEATSL